MDGRIDLRPRGAVSAARLILAPAILMLAAPTAGAADAAVDRLDAIAPALARCWRPLHQGDEATVRLMFRRDGTVIGTPRVTYVQPGGRAGEKPPGAGDATADEAALAEMLLQAVRDCTPMRFTPSMGGAIAGRLLSIRLIASPASGVR